jgi:hypothetical protein
MIRLGIEPDSCCIHFLSWYAYYLKDLDLNAMAWNLRMRKKKKDLTTRNRTGSLLTVMQCILTSAWWRLKGRAASVVLPTVDKVRWAIIASPSSESCSESNPQDSHTVLLSILARCRVDRVSFCWHHTLSQLKENLILSKFWALSRHGRMYIHIWSYCN